MEVSRSAERTSNLGCNLELFRGLLEAFARKPAAGMLEASGYEAYALEEAEDVHGVV